MERARVGIIGCGNISGNYLSHARLFDNIDVVACADLVAERASEMAAKFDVSRSCTVDELLAADDVDIVLNLTIPKAHTEVNLAAIAAGKHVYVEKPFAMNRDDGKKVLDAARAQSVLACGAPDTFLGGGIQTCRKLLDDGQIGSPVAAVACMACPGHESWHPSPDFYYQAGGGPLFDMGPYYITALVTLLGPVRRVTGFARISTPERIVTSAGNNGRRIPVETPTHISATLEFESGPLGTLLMSFDVQGHHLPIIEIYGTECTMSVPDPNAFGGQIELHKRNERPHFASLTHSDRVGRCIGVADMAAALEHNRPVRASGELAYHVLDVMQSVLEAGQTGTAVEVASTCERPAALPAKQEQCILDA